jgi:hypothetical protein
MKIAAERPKGPHGAIVQLAWHRHDVECRPDIDPCGAGVDDDKLP